MPAMHILVNYMYYLRPGSGGGRRFNEFCRLWAEQPGVQVTVLAGIFDHFKRSVYPDLSRKPDSWELDGPVRVRRVASPECYDSGFVKRAWSQYWWGRNSVRALAQIERPDIVLSSSPNLWAALPMLAAKRRWRIPAVFEIRDMWPEALVQHRIAGASNPAVTYLGYLEWLACRNADKVTVIVDTMRNSLTRRGLKASEDIRLFPNGILLDKYEQLPTDSRERVRARLGIPAGSFVCMYVGGVGRIHAVENFVDVATEFRDEPRFHFVCVGDGPDRPALEALASDRGLGRLQFTGSVPTDEVPVYLSAADCGVAVVNVSEGTGWDNETRGIFRNAFFDIAGARLPVVFNIPGFPEAEVAGRARGGLYAADAGGLAEHIRTLAADPALAQQLGENNYQEIAVRYNRRRVASEYLELMRGLVNGRRR
jgi:glycosyltransferase involved in cell wall biosynthesis